MRIAPATNEARSYEVLRLSHKIILPKLKIWCSKMQPLSGKLCPWPPNISDEHVFCIAPATRNESSQILFKCPTPAIVFGHATRPSRFARFWQGAQSLAPARRNDIWTPKVFRCPSVFCAFDFDMCSAPQRRALFRHLNFQKWSERGVLCTFWLGHVLRATTACTFSSLIGPAGCALAALASLLFDPSEPQIIGETPCFATFLPFRAPASSFLWLFLFFDLLSSSLLFSSLTLSTSAFPSVHIVGSLTSKLPSIICWFEEWNIIFGYAKIVNVANLDGNDSEKILWRTTDNARTCLRLQTDSIGS